MSKAAEDWVDFDAAYNRADWSNTRTCRPSDANNRGNAYRIFLEMEKSQFKTDKPGR